MTGWAARYSIDIERDIRRGYSFMGWAITPQPTEEALRESLVEKYYWPESLAENCRVEYCEDAGGYLPAHKGLCAWYSDEEEDPETGLPEGIIEDAKRDRRFLDIPLYVFEAEYLGQDVEDGTDIVRPVGKPMRVN